MKNQNSKQLTVVAQMDPTLATAIKTVTTVAPYVAELVKYVRTQQGSGQNNQKAVRATPRKMKRGVNVQGLNVVQAAGSASTINMLTGTPKLSYASDTVTITHSEVLGTLKSSNGVNRAIIPVNNEITPWLTQESQHYGRWRPKSITIRYMPTCSTNTNGSVVLAPIHDGLTEGERNNAGISSLMSMSGAVSGNLWSSNIPVMSWDCSKLNNEWFETLPNDPTIARQAIGMIYVATQSDAAVECGRLMITYVFQFAYNRPELAADDDIITNFAVTRFTSTGRRGSEYRIQPVITTTTNTGNGGGGSGGEGGDGGGGGSNA